MPHIIPHIVQLINQGALPGRKLYGPVTLLQKDLSWSDCDVDPSTGIITQRATATDTCLFEKIDTNLHITSEVLRRQIANRIQQKQEK